MKIPGCASGHHSDQKPARPEVKADDTSGLTKPIVEIKHIPLSIEPSAASDPIVTENLALFVTPTGNHKCSNAGCGKEYDPSSNGDDSCNYHSGKAGFRDTRKFWSCCNASSYDWDEFMKIPTCCVGPHQPKMIPESLS